jgi:hypothetical protein
VLIASTVNTRERVRAVCEDTTIRGESERMNEWTMYGGGREGGMLRRFIFVRLGFASFPLQSKERVGFKFYRIILYVVV